MVTTNSFIGRKNLTELIENNLSALFPKDEVTVVPYGVMSILKDKDDVNDYLKELQVNQKPAEMIIKFAPDYIIFKKSEPKELFFLEVKCSVTPCWASSRIKNIKDIHPNERLNESNIGEIAREALLSYNRFYPNTIILYGTSYNSKVLMAQFADKVECLFCYRKDGKYDCEKCPSKTGGYFDLERNSNSAGSQTPNTNINLDSFERADSFFEKIGISLDRNTWNNICNSIKNAGISLPDKVENERAQEIKNVIYDSGCSWIRRMTAYYIALNNAFYHSDINCVAIKNKNAKKIFENDQQLDGKMKCKWCNKE